MLRHDELAALQAQVGELQAALGSQNKGKGKRKGGKRNRSNKVPVWARASACHNCDSYDHHQSDCPHPKVCIRCKEPGHKRIFVQLLRRLRVVNPLTLLPS